LERPCRAFENSSKEVAAVKPNHALHTDALGLSRPLQGKGRASQRRAGERER
jgi:hypothetical protein